MVTVKVQGGSVIGKGVPPVATWAARPSELAEHFRLYRSQPALSFSVRTPCGPHLAGASGSDTARLAPPPPSAGRLGHRSRSSGDRATAGAAASRTTRTTPETSRLIASAARDGGAVRIDWRTPTRTRKRWGRDSLRFAVRDRCRRDPPDVLVAAGPPGRHDALELRQRDPPVPGVL